MDDEHFTAEAIRTMDGLNIVNITTGILDDLDKLRAGTISVSDARARAELAKQALRAVGYVLQAQKLLSDSALQIGDG
ncbi:MAG TPA: hypothetical protein PKI99_02005, partial [Terrimesophilobacter sp.]|nr:hypothetical protein [Terrimesophilobacter sp.]